MTKKITYMLILCLLLFSCGKKGDPKFKEPENNAKIQNLPISNV